MLVIDKNINLDNIEEIINKSFIINEFIKLFKNSPINYDFFISHQIASEIAEHVSSHIVFPKAEGTDAIIKAYDYICKLYNKDSSIIYNTIDEIIGL